MTVRQGEHIMSPTNLVGQVGIDLAGGQKLGGRTMLVRSRDCTYKLKGVLHNCCHTLYRQVVLSCLHGTPWQHCSGSVVLAL